MSLCIYILFVCLSTYLSPFEFDNWESLDTLYTMYVGDSPVDFGQLVSLKLAVFALLMLVLIGLPTPFDASEVGNSYLKISLRFLGPGEYPFFPLKQQKGLFVQ